MWNKCLWAGRDWILFFKKTYDIMPLGKRIRCSIANSKTKTPEVSHTSGVFYSYFGSGKA